MNVTAGEGACGVAGIASGRQISGASLFALLHWGGWAAFGAMPFAYSVSSWGFWGALLNKLLFAVSGALTCLGLRHAYRRARLSKVSCSVIAPAVLLACGVLAEVWYLAQHLVARWSFNELSELNSFHAQFAYGARQFEDIPLLIPLSQWFVYCFALLTWSSLYFGINSITALEMERARVAHALKVADTVRLRALQSQLNPHFLVHALNGLVTLIRENKGPAAANMVSTLSDFLRATLRTVNTPEITVCEELILVDQYVELQQLRFADRLEVIVDAAEETYSALLPTLIMQPLVENAIQHGMLMQERGSVVISIKKDAEQLLVTVEDDGQGPTRAGPQRLGVGLTNTSARLRALYAERATMSLRRSIRGGFVVELRVPFRNRKKEIMMSIITTVAS